MAEYLLLIIAYPPSARERQTVRTQKQRHERLSAGKTESEEMTMSLADHVFISMCKDVLENGTSTEGEKVRPVWEDGTAAYTIKKFGVVNRYDLRKEFPALTLRKTCLLYTSRCV